MRRLTMALADERRWATLWRWADRPLTLLLVVAALWGGVLAAQLRRYEGDISRFVMAGERLVAVAELPPGLTVMPDSWGYDGVFFYRLALEPFTHEVQKYGVPLLPPLYRQQRILYPLLAHLAAGGQPQYAPLAMVGINLVGLLALGYLSGCYARLTGRPALLGAGLALYPGYLMTFSRNLAEIVMAALLLAGLLAWQRQRYLWAGLALALATLTRETTLLLPVGLGLAHLPVLWSAVRQEAGGAPARLPRVALRAMCDRRLLAFMLPAAAWLLWQLWLRANWAGAEQAAMPFESNFAAPLQGLGHFVRQLGRQPGHVRYVWAGELLLLAGLAMAALLSLRVSQAPAGFKAAWALYLCMILSLSRNVWVEDYAYLRAITEFYLLSCVVLLQAPGRRAAIVMGTFAACWALLACDLLLIR